MTIPPSPSSAGSHPVSGSPPDPAAYLGGVDDADSTSQTPAGPPAADALAFDDDTVRVGDTLKDRFILKEFLGAGGMGKVFKALDLRKEEAADRNPYVAVKVLKERMAGHSASIIALQREARKAQELSHPNIIKVYDFDRDGFRFFITMEYLTGRSLDRIIRSDDFTPMTQPEAAGIVGAVGAALSFAHASGFLHWDLKPGNIFVTDKGRVKVIDFGLSRAFKRSGPAEDATIADVTNFDVASLGGMTPAYASPEMIETQTADPRGDVFSLACITYELLTGRHPFGRIPSTHARDANIRPQRIPSLRNGQWQALERALAFDPKKRTDSIDHFLVDLALDRVALSRRPLPVVPMVAAAELADGNTVPNGTYLDMCAHLPVLDPLQIACPVCIIRGEYDGIAAEPDLLDFFGKLPSKDKQFVFVSGLAHAATLGINRHKFWHAMESFMNMPANRALVA